MGRVNEPIPRGSVSPKFLKAQITHASLVLAAAALLREEGPEAVSYRRVAKMAGAASSAVGYYFDSLDEMLQEAEGYNIQLWVGRSETVAKAAEDMTPARCRKMCAKLLAGACLPDKRSSPFARYCQLISVVDGSLVVEEYRKGYRAVEGNLARILAHAGVHLDVALVMAVADGAAVGALSEGYNVRAFAERMLRDIVEATDQPGPAMPHTSP